MATNDELLKIWAQQNGSDYNVLAGAQNGGNTGGTSANNDIYSEYGWNSGTLPGTSTPTTTQTQTNPTTPTSTQQPTATNPYPYMQDYIDYYTAIGQQPDKSYDEWVSWRNGGGTTQTTTPTGTGGTGTTPTTTPTTPTTQTQPSGLSTTDYINYYTSRGITQPPIGYDAWVQMMQGGGEQQPTANPTTPANPTNPSTPTTTTTQGTSVEDYVNYYKNLGMTTPDKDYETWVAWIQSGGDTQTPTNPSNPSSPSNPSNPSNPTNPTNPSSPTTQGTSVQDYITYWTSRGVTTPPMGYEEWVRFITNGGGTTTPGSTGAPGTGTSGSNVTHNYPTVDMDNRQRISDMYDAQINAQRAALQEQGDQALSDAQANRDKIASLYNKQRNAASVDWERQRRNFLEGAATSGLNTGAGSQAELSMMSAYQRSQNDLGAAQAQAEAEADRNIADIKRSTQASISEAIAKNDYQKAAALLDEYNAQYNRAMDRAEVLAQYGDFSGYAALYGDEAAAQMRYTWIMQNPEIALATGQITQQQYTQLVLYSKYPTLAMTGGAGATSTGSQATSDILRDQIYQMVRDGRMSPEEAAGIDTDF